MSDWLQVESDTEVAAKVLTLILAAMNAADADRHSALRLRFVRMLLDKGGFYPWLWTQIVTRLNRGTEPESASRSVLYLSQDSKATTGPARNQDIKHKAVP